MIVLGFTEDMYSGLKLKQQLQAFFVIYLREKH